MARVTGFTAERMLAIENATIIAVEVDSHQHLIVTRHDGQQIDVGDISAVSRLSVQDSTTIDLTLEGNGSDATPWKLRGDLKAIDWSALPPGLIPADRLPKLSSGLLSASYLGGETAPVVGTPGGAVLGNYKWAGRYNPQGSRSVRLIKDGDDYQILGQTEDGVYPLTLASNWYTYNEITVSRIFNDRVTATLLKSGLVVLSGLIRVNGVAADGSLITTLPTNLVPDASIMYPIINNDNPGGIKINTNGTITCYGALTTNGYVSLDGVAFWPASSNIPWTNIGSGGSAFAADFEEWGSGTSEWGRAKYYKDPYGFVWMQGLVRRKTTVATDNTPILSLPTTHRANLSQHFRSLSGAGTSPAIGANLDGNVVWKLGGPTAIGSFLTLSTLCITTTDALNNNPWWRIGYTANGWTFQPGTGTSFPQAALLRREDGLCLMKGILAPGTMGATAFNVQRAEYIPRHGRIIIAIAANNASGRLNIYSSEEFESGKQKGGVDFSSGSTWFSLDSVKYLP